MPDSTFQSAPASSGLSGLDHRALLDAHLAGDRGAFAVLVRRYRPLMMVIAERTVRELAESKDVVQSALLGVPLGRVVRPPRDGDLPRSR